MKKKLIIAIIALVVLAGIGFGAFKLYLHYYKAESEIQSVETASSGTQDQTASGVSINNFDHLSGTYRSHKTDPVTSEILFETYGTTATKGKFKDFEIVASFNNSNQADLNVSIDVSSIYTASEMRDDHLRSEEFFDAKKYTTITFQSNETVKGDTSYIAKGEITFLGKTKSLEVPFQYIGTAKGDNAIEVFKGKFNFNPIAYGMGGDSGAGEEVTVTFETQLKKD